AMTAAASLKPPRPADRPHLEEFGDTCRAGVNEGARACWNVTCGGTVSQVGATRRSPDAPYLCQTHQATPSPATADGSSTKSPMMPDVGRRNVITIVEARTGTQRGTLAARQSPTANASWPATFRIAPANAGPHTASILSSRCS